MQTWCKSSPPTLHQPVYFSGFQKIDIAQNGHVHGKHDIYELVGFSSWKKWRKPREATINQVWNLSMAPFYGTSTHEILGQKAIPHLPSVRSKSWWWSSCEENWLLSSKSCRWGSSNMAWWSQWLEGESFMEDSIQIDDVGVPPHFRKPGIWIVAKWRFYMEIRHFWPRTTSIMVHVNDFGPTFAPAKNDTRNDVGPTWSHIFLNLSSFQVDIVPC